MDNHPIPQDVTHFQFKLIGDLTIKQFGYLIGGVILAWLILLLPVIFLFKFILASIVLGVGVILAFVPFEGRPSDVMFIHFFKALFTPNQYNYQPGSTTQTHVDNTQSPVKKDEPATNATVFFQSSPVPVTPIQQQQQITAPAFSNPTQAPTGPEEEKQSPAPASPAAPLVAEEATLEKELTEAKKAEAEQQAGSEGAALAHQKVQELETQLHEVFLQKQDLEKQILDLKEQLAQKKSQQVFTPSEAPQEQPKETAHVIKIPKQMAKSVGLPIMPDVPNLLSGIVKDPRGNSLPNILIEVKDKDGNAVRAFKTNNLGQFASATPLLNGVYTVSFEDPQAKNSFDLVEITASGDILTPIEVISVDQREKLRQELFGA